MYSQGVWSSPPTGPSPSSVGMPCEAAQEPSETPPAAVSPNDMAELCARARWRSRPAVPRGPSARTAAGRRDPRTKARRLRARRKSSTRSSAQVRSSSDQARRSAVREPALGTVLRPSPASSPVIWSVSSCARAVELADAQRLAGERDGDVATLVGRLPCVCGSPRGVNAEPARALAARHDLAVRAPALEAEDGVHAEQPPARRRPAVPGLLVRHATRPRAGRTAAGPSASSRAVCSATATPPFMSATPGP